MTNKSFWHILGRIVDWFYVALSVFLLYNISVSWLTGDIGLTLPNLLLVLLAPIWIIMAIRAIARSTSLWRVGEAVWSRILGYTTLAIFLTYVFYIIHRYA